MLKANNDYKMGPEDYKRRTMENHPAEPIENQIKRRKWNWIGYTLRKEVGAIRKTALDWNSEG
jgi:hypothetical protein